MRESFFVTVFPILICAMFFSSGPNVLSGAESMSPASVHAKDSIEFPYLILENKKSKTKIYLITLSTVTIDNGKLYCLSDSIGVDDIFVMYMLSTEFVIKERGKKITHGDSKRIITRYIPSDDGDYKVFSLMTSRTFWGPGGEEGHAMPSLRWYDEGLLSDEHNVLLRRILDISLRIRDENVPVKYGRFLP